jgi:flagellar basal body-associated protein FliL
MGMDNTEEYRQYRKKRIAKMKKIILLLVILLILLPTVLCIVLFLQLHDIQRQLDGVGGLFIVRAINYVGGCY